MFVDIVFPKDNEKEFIAMAKKLGYDGLVFLYPRGKKVNTEYRKIKDIEIMTATLVTQKDLNKQHPDITIVKAADDSRVFFESKKIDMIFGLEDVSRKDFIHHYGSGLNQVLAKFANLTGKSIGFSFSMLLCAKGKKKAILMSRISQNIRFCRKYKVDMVTASFASNPYHMRAPNDIMATMRLLGMNGSEAKKSVSGKNFK